MSSVILIFILLIIFLALLIFGYKVTTGPTTATPEYKIDIVNDKPVLTQIEPSDCKGDVYTMKTSCSRNGVVLDGTENKCGPGKEEWVLDPDAPGFQGAIGTGSCPVDYRDCEVECDKPCRGETWIEGNCIRDSVILDGSETDKCGRGMRTYTLDESAPDYVPAKGRGVCMKTYSSACDVECPQNAVAPPACVYSSTWQKSANGCVVSKDDKARQVGYDEDGWQESFKLALEAENCTGEKRLSEWETCKGAPAPVDCVGTWGPNDGWGPCTGPCGTQPQQKRKYTVTREAKNGGKACPYENGKEETKSCGTIVTCPVDCQGSWINATCPTACGTAASTVFNTWYTSRQPQGTGKACPSPSPKTCPATPSCPWVAIGGCTSNGKQYYTRNTVNNGDATSKTENCCYEGNQWRNVQCNPNNSVMQHKTLVNCSKSHQERTIPNGCNYQKCTVQTWKDSDQRGYTWQIRDRLPNVANTGSKQDEISSYAKYGSCNATAYQHVNYGGWGLTLYEGRHNVPRWANDQISSIKIEHLPYSL